MLVLVTVVDGCVCMPSKRQNEQVLVLQMPAQIKRLHRPSYQYLSERRAVRRVAVVGRDAPYRIM